MDESRTIDVRGIPHHERETLIFPALEALSNGQVLRIVLEFNPLPLVHMLKARNDLDVSYETDGPDQWVLRVRRVRQGENRKELFKALLKELREGDVSNETKEKAKELLQAIDAESLGLIEQELIREGVSHDEIRRSLCDIHLEVLGDSLVSSRIEVEAPHPVNTFMEEHQVILDKLSELGAIVDRLERVSSPADLQGELAALREVAQHLVEAESHHQREEQVLFPILERHDIVEPPSIMAMDHVEFRKRKQELYQLSQNPEAYSFEALKEKVVALGTYLTRELEGHIFKEDNILYQIALQVLSTEEWEQVKRGCDEIGYCCFTPQHATGEAEVVTLDLRPMPPFQRHERIFALWHDLKPGQVLRIVNDHDPKPLYYQFSAEYEGEFKWSYRVCGPVDWEVDIVRVKETTSSALREKVDRALASIRPYLVADGGDVELIDVSDEGIVSVRLVGRCRGCPGAVMTLRMGVERRLKEQVPEITGVEAV
jgi:uncharacterized protein (DUF2249 family)/hemerythrin-like domain-containing protein